jgi:hypothetical protein
VRESAKASSFVGQVVWWYNGVKFDGSILLFVPPVNDFRDNPGLQ